MRPAILLVFYSLHNILAETNTALPILEGGGIDIQVDQIRLVYTHEQSCRTILAQCNCCGRDLHDNQFHSLVIVEDEPPLLSQQVFFRICPELVLALLLYSVGYFLSNSDSFFLKVGNRIGFRPFTQSKFSLSVNRVD